LSEIDNNSGLFIALIRADNNLKFLDMKTRAKIAMVIATIITLSACSSTQVMTDYRKGTDYSGMRSYQIRHQPEINGVSALDINSLNQDRIENALQSNLQQRGLIASDHPDFIVAYSISSRVEKSYYTTQHNPYYGGRWGWYGGGMSNATTTESESVYGELMIAVIDANTNQMVWYAVVSKPLSENIKNRETEINKAVEKALIEFPIKQMSPVISTESEIGI
jgi:hypothetical protein